MMPMRTASDWLDTLLALHLSNDAGRNRRIMLEEDNVLALDGFAHERALENAHISIGYRS